MTEFSAFRTKTYSYLMDDRGTPVTKKKQKEQRNV